MPKDSPRARVIDGKAEAGRMAAGLAARVQAFRDATGRAPGLAVVLVGDNPASEIYVRTKAKQAKAVGMSSFEFHLEPGVGEDEVLDLVERLNADDMVDGILIQLPLPKQVSSAKVLRRIDPGKDVDGFHPLNAGLLAIGQQGVVPCTPLGCLHLVRTVCADLRGLDVTIIGCSTIVGRPAAQVFLNASCTVTSTHIDTRDVKAHCQGADILIAAAGAPGLVKADWVKPGAIVIDVGITRVGIEGGKSKIVGDVDFPAVQRVAGAITPVPGGVGPMTVAMLLENTLSCASRLMAVPPATPAVGDAITGMLAE